MTAVIAAAGSGERLGAGVPKAFVPLAGRPMIEWSIDALRACDSVRSIVVAVPPGHIHDLGGHDLGVVNGGATRAQSVAAALAAVGTGLVAIHDAARPLLTAELVEELVARLDATPTPPASSPPPPWPTRSSKRHLGQARARILCRPSQKRKRQDSSSSER